jgi:hypothetical protein
MCCIEKINKCAVVDVQMLAVQVCPLRSTDKVKDQGQTRDPAFHLTHPVNREAA